MIPNKIHYCWFGYGEKTKLVQKCIASWKKYCPDYEIIEWNETNFDVNKNAYTKMCYEQKKYAFLTDYIRLIVIAEYGGIYLDTDVELVRNIDKLLENRAFFGFETDEYVATGLGFGAESGNKMIIDMLQEYDELLDGQHGVIGCPILNTQRLVKEGLIQNGQKQEIDGVIIYPRDCFNPYDDSTGRLNITENTYSIHWYGKSWMSKSKVMRSKITRPFHRIFGTECFRWLKKL